MENCTIYSHYLNFDKVIEIVKTELPEAFVETQEDEGQKFLMLTLKHQDTEETSTLEIKYRERTNPSYKLEKITCGLTQNLAGMIDYITSLPAKNENIKNKLIFKTTTINTEMPFMAKPKMIPVFTEILRKIILALDAFIFTAPNVPFNKAQGQHFLDKHLNLILDTDGNSEIEDIKIFTEAKYQDEPIENYKPDQLERKKRTAFILKDKQIKTNEYLPCIVSSENVELRTKEEIIGRALALIIIIGKGKDFDQKGLDDIVEQKQINSFSPEETRIYKASELNEQDRINAVWRYESLNVLLWALGKIEELKYPDDICDVQNILDITLPLTREEFETSVKMRSVDEILDELDKTYRFDWACVDARIHGEEVSGNLNSGVVYERHYALNWLTKFENQDWDDVQTPT